MVNVQQEGGSIRVAINTNALTLGSSMPAKSSFQGHSNASTANPASDEQSSSAEDSGTSTGSAPAPAAAANGSTGTQKSTGPSVQTRGNARARTTTGPISPQSNSETQATPDTPSTDFVSAMASALVRSTTSAPDLPASTPATATATADTSDATSRTGTSQPASAPATDAVAWIAQVLIPVTSDKQAATATATAAPTTTVAGAKRADSALGAIQAGARAATIGATAVANAAALTGQPAESDAVSTDPQAINGFAAQLAAQNDLAAGQSRARANANPPAPSLSAQSSDAQTPASAAPATSAIDNVNALADVQKLISGLTNATTTDADADAESSVATPQAHPAATGASSDVGAAAAALQSAALTRSSSSLGNTTLTIHAPVGSPAFADDVTTQVTGLAQSGVTQAQLQLNPADMGPVQVHITLQAGQASVWFSANHADTRAALEQSLPRLRELFAGAGMPLTDSGVFREPPQQQRQSVPAANSATATADPAVAPTVTQVSNIRLALLDTYA
jgi:flagellar hook-length control protein FliK